MESASMRWKHLESMIAASWAPAEWTDFNVVLAVSGGADSVAMARAIQRLHQDADGTGELVVAHFHHGLRPEADEDAQWLRRFCVERRLELVVGDGDVRRLASEQGDGVEAAARSARHAFLAETAARRGARYVVTGHTADDQVETVLFRILRGTGLRGLAGMRLSRELSPGVSLMRPMLGVTRAEVLEYLASIDQDWREDATNSDIQYARNRIRHELMPLIRADLNEQADEALLRLAHAAGNANTLIHELATPFVDAHVRFISATGKQSQEICCGTAKDVSSMRIDANSIASRNDLLVAEILRAAWRRAGWPEQAMTEAHWNWLVELIHNRAEPPKRVLPAGILASRTVDQINLLYEP